jgi:uncharacterized membrane protein
MQVFLGVVLGIILGAVMFDGRGVPLGAVLGWIVATLLNLNRRLDRLEAATRPPPEVKPATSPLVPDQPPVAASVAPAPAVVPEPSATVWISPPSTPAEPAESELVRRVREFILGGNTAVRLGVVVLFFGVAFLLKYAVEHSLLPIELRLAGAAAGGIVLLVLGWRLRERRSGYALTLQGGGIGILYLTVFAALRLYQLIPAGAAFALLVGIVVFSALLALRQSSLALAVLGVTGGFLAPILTSTGTGNHVMLFGYYALLNAGIMLVSWFRAWRMLNLVGFAFTFVIGASWGYRYYRPEFFASTEPFLALFFLMYVAIAVISALRQPPDLRGYVDGTLVFGVPIMGALLQAALVHDIEYGLAWSALALGFFYLALAGTLFKRSPQTLRFLVEVFLALGVIFATLAIPLAFEGRWTAAAWSVEGAGILWVGVRQQRRGARWFGVTLIFVAGLFFLSDSRATSGLAVLNAHYIGTLMIAAAALFAGRMLHGAREVLHEEPLIVACLVWGLLWWYGGGVREIERYVAWQWTPAVSGVFVALSSLAAELLGRSIRWPTLRTSCAVLLPVLAVFLLYGWFAYSHPFANAGYAAWLAGFGAFYYMAYRQEPDKAMFAETAQHALTFMLLTAVVTLESAWAMRELVPEGRDWQRMAWLSVPAAMLALAARKPVRWPLTKQRQAYLIYAALPIAFGVLLVVLYTSARSPGEPAPLDYLPLANPLELATLFAALATTRWLLALRALDPAGWRDTWRALVGLAVAVGFVWLNAVLFRSLHHFGGIKYGLEPMFRSVLAQASLSIFWSVLALILVIVATRLRQRFVWIGGAVLLGVVVVKLFLVDLAGTGTVARIVSFIGVGILLLIIGYLAPVPPRATEEGKT